MLWLNVKSGGVGSGVTSECAQRKNEGRAADLGEVDEAHKVGAGQLGARLVEAFLWERAVRISSSSARSFSSASSEIEGGDAVSPEGTTIANSGVRRERNRWANGLR